MAISTLSAIPDSFEAGTTTLFTEGFTDFPVADWAAYLILAKPGDPPVRVDATVSGTNFLFTLTAANTAAMKSGWYDYAIYVTDGAERARAKSGRIIVDDNLDVQQAPTHAEAMVTTLEKALLLLGATTDSSVSFNGQSFTQSSIGTYRQDYVFWKAAVIRERREQQALRGTSHSGFVAIHFG